MSKRDGVYRKFDVRRTDGTDQKLGDKHFNCVYFVLDISHDKFAAAALRAYAEACKDELPELSADVEDLAIVNQLETGDELHELQTNLLKQFPPACYRPVVKIAMESRIVGDAGAQPNTITVDGNQHEASGTFYGAQLRQRLGVPDDRDLFLAVTGGLDDQRVTEDRPFHIYGGERFYTAPKVI